MEIKEERSTTLYNYISEIIGQDLFKFAIR